MTKITLLHISDMHFSKYEKHLPIIPIKLETAGNIWNALKKGSFAASYSRQNLRALIRFIRENRKQTDAVVVTGDIATTGLDFDLEPARNFIAGDPDLDPDLKLVEPTLENFFGKEHLLILPGNHDRYQIFEFFGSMIGRRVGYFPGNNLFDTEFEDYWENYVRRMVLTRDNLAVGVFAADFNLQSFMHCRPFSPHNWYAQGKVYGKILDDLVEATKKFKDDPEFSEFSDKFIIWAVHFPPVDGIAIHSSLLEKERLVEAALSNECGVSLILAGHIHSPQLFDLSPDLKVLTTGSTTQHYAPDGNFCHLISVENNAGNYHVERRCYKLEKDDAGLNFLPDGSVDLIDFSK